MDTILKRDHPRIISAKFGWDWLSSFRGEEFFLISSPLFSTFSLAAFLVGSRDHRTQFWKGAFQGSFHKSLVEIGSVASEEMIFFFISSPLFSIFSLAAILVGSRDHRTQFWKGAIQGSFQKGLVAIGPVVSEEKIFMWISHRVLC